MGMVLRSNTDLLLVTSVARESVSGHWFSAGIMIHTYKLSCDMWLNKRNNKSGIWFIKKMGWSDIINYLKFCENHSRNLFHFLYIFNINRISPWLSTFVSYYQPCHGSKGKDYWDWNIQKCKQRLFWNLLQKVTY